MLSETVETKGTNLALCKERGGGGGYWENAVQARILCVRDLHEVDAVYHRVCSATFHTMKQLPAARGNEGMPLKRAKSGRPVENHRAEAFLEVAKFLEENDDEQITIQDLVQQMEKILANSKHSAYGYQHMQQRLKEHFRNKIIETEINGKPNAITFRSKASEVLYNFHSQCDLDPEKEKLRIVETAARLIKEDIKAMKTCHSTYPSVDQLRSNQSINFLPNTLRVSLAGTLVAEKAYRPRLLLLDRP